MIGYALIVKTSSKISISIPEALVSFVILSPLFVIISSALSTAETIEVITL